jgi:hypothetical protein
VFESPKRHQFSRTIGLHHKVKMVVCACLTYLLSSRCAAATGQLKTVMPRFQFVSIKSFISKLKIARGNILTAIWNPAFLRTYNTGIGQCGTK